MISTSGRFNYLVSFLVRNTEEFYQGYQELRELFGKNIRESAINIAVRGIQYDYPFFKDNYYSKIITAAEHYSRVNLDEKSLDILSILSEDCRTPIKEISNQLCINEKTVRSKIKSMENSNTIMRYSIHIHPGRVGYFFHMILIRFTIPNMEILEYAKSIPEIFFIVEGAGFFDLQLEFYCKEEKRIHDIEEEFHKKFGDLISQIDIIYIKKEYLVNYFIR